MGCSFCKDTGMIRDGRSGAIHACNICKKPKPTKEAVAVCDGCHKPIFKGGSMVHMQNRMFHKNACLKKFAQEHQITLDQLLVRAREG